MTPQQHQRATDLFEAALQRPPAERDLLLARACDDDPAVAGLVRRMLLQHDSPAFDLDSAPLSGPLSGILGAQLNVAVFSDDACNSTAMPKQIGPYAILGILGTGGMSVVYRARQEFPDRIIALKVLRRAALSHAALRRFRMEVDTLARLSHPNIAQIYQAGSYDDGDADAASADGGGGGGRPYFAMELIEGLPLTEYAQRHGLNLRQKLELMIAVCRAVQYAHLKSVIHRDLKPGNILVMEDAVDGLKSVCPIPKILDFGIARATDVDVNRATLTAETGQIVGTLPYMSPEQLSGDANALDLRSDVYALGVILFELLTGTLPHALDDAAPLTEAIRRISDSEPRRLGTIDRKWRGELEVIAATAMERDRHRRYQSAEALADDLQAYLDHRPIRAKPPGLALRARKWLRRHPTAATVAGVVALALLAITSLVVVQQRQARQAAARDLALLMDAARREVNAYAADLDASRRRETELLDVHNRLYRYNPPQQALQLEQRERQLLQAKNEHEAALHHIIDLLARAQRQGVPENEIHRMQARVYFARVREAEAAGDRFARSMYLLLARQNDPTGELAGEMLERFPLSVRTDPPGAEAHLFRLVEQSELIADGEPRMVPVGWRSVQQEPRGAKSEAGQTQKPVPEIRRLTGAAVRFALRVVDGREVLNDDDIVLWVNEAPIRDSVFVLSAAPAHGLQPLDRLISIDGREVHDLYDAYPPLPGVNAAATAPATQHTFIFERAAGPSGTQTRVTVSGASLEALGIRAGDAAAALSEAGGPAQLWRRGQVRTMNVPPGLSYRVTAKPMLVSDESLLGVTPIANVPVERGRDILLLIKDGFEPLRIPLDVHEGGMIAAMQSSTWKLLPRGSTPPGFVRACLWENPSPEPYWIMEREITLGEYIEFLNDPEILTRINASLTPILYPHSGSYMEIGRETAGARLFNAGPEHRPDEPVHAISWYDAMEYVRWRNRRDHASGAIPAHMEYDLPTHLEWLCAWGCSGENQYPWGMHFRAYWTSSNYARQHPAPEPVMRFPIDETNVGVFDMAGSMSEWLNAWWIEERDQREIAGGSWGHGGGFNYSDMFMLYGQNGQTATVTNGTVGFRLVMRKAAPH